MRQCASAFGSAVRNGDKRSETRRETEKTTAAATQQSTAHDKTQHAEQSNSTREETGELPNSIQYGVYKVTVHSTVQFSTLQYIECTIAGRAAPFAACAAGRAHCVAAYLRVRVRDPRAVQWSRVESRGERWQANA